MSPNRRCRVSAGTETSASRSCSSSRRAALARWKGSAFRTPRACKRSSSRSRVWPLAREPKYARASSAGLISCKISMTVLFLCFFDGCGQAFPGSIPRFSRPVPLALIIHLFFRQNKGTPRRCGGFLQSCNTQPFCMGRTVDFSCRMLYDKNGFARTQSRIIESCPRMPCGGYRKGRKTARCQPERNGAKEPHANGTVSARMHRSGLDRRDESPPLGAAPLRR